MAPWPSLTMSPTTSPLVFQRNPLSTLNEFPVMS